MMDHDGLLMFFSTILGSLGAILGPSGGHFWAILVLSWGDLWFMMVPRWSVDGFMMPSMASNCVSWFFFVFFVHVEAILCLCGPSWGLLGVILGCKIASTWGYFGLLDPNLGSR